MNKGKICVSVSAATADEMFRMMERARGSADLVEIRFDHLCDTEVGKLVGLLKLDASGGGSRLLATFRAKDQGGNRDLSPEERREFWNSGIESLFWGGDFEEDLIERSFDKPWSHRIGSHHDFAGVPDDLCRIYERLKDSNPDVVKIAVTAHDITDTIAVWQLLQRANSEGRRATLTAMGEAGKSTRILGLARGAFVTYASFEEGGGTAPGQISAADLTDIFHIKELDAETEVYGIIAGDTSYSVSPFMHNAAFRSRGLNSVFVPLQTRDVDSFVRRMVDPETREVELNFKGFSVTNPHKQAIIKHLADVDDAAREIGAVNTVKIESGKLFGYNTDAPGFIEPLKRKFPDLKGSRAAVVGAGGAARACIYSLINEGAEVVVFGRDAARTEALKKEFAVGVEQLATAESRLPTPFPNFDIVVNATPLGTKGEFENETIANADQLSGVKLVYDLIYNPAQTRLIREAKAAGAETLGGLEMLIAQGARQFAIWNGQDAPVEEMAAAVRKRLGL